MSCSAPLPFINEGAAPAKRITGDSANWAFFKEVIVFVTP